LHAGARSLLVSHWPVNSEAAVMLSTGAFAALSREPWIGKAEAMRRSMLAMIEQPSNDLRAHPAYWAPFVLIGTGR
jgi:CHAT domain-containing protein